MESRPRFARIIIHHIRLPLLISIGSKVRTNTIAMSFSIFFGGCFLILWCVRFSPPFMMYGMHFSILS